MPENGNLKKGRFSAKVKKWSVSYYMERLLANQNAGKPVRISCHIIKKVTTFGLLYSDSWGLLSERHL